MKLTKERAKELSIRKWEWIIENNGFVNNDRLIEELPELFDLAHYCGLCELYCFEHDSELSHCLNCPIRPKREYYNNTTNTGCFQRIHPYYIWYNEPNIENAQAVLELIKNIEI